MRSKWWRRHRQVFNAPVFGITTSPDPEARLVEIADELRVLRDARLRPPAPSRPLPLSVMNVSAGISVGGWSFLRRLDGSVFIVCPDDGSVHHDFSTLGESAFTLTAQQWKAVVTAMTPWDERPAR